MKLTTLPMLATSGVLHFGVRGLITTRSLTASLLRVIAVPNPNECIGQGLLEYATVTVSGPASENKALVVTFRFQRGRSALARHHPVVMSLLGIIGTQIVF